MRTRNSFTGGEGFDPNFIYLEETGAQYLAELGVKGVGIDALGIERDQPAHETHRILFERGIIIIEGLCLRNVKAGTYLMVATPLCLVGGEASPVRVLLLSEGFLKRFCGSIAPSFKG